MNILVRCFHNKATDWVHRQKCSAEVHIAACAEASAEFQHADHITLRSIIMCFSLESVLLGNHTGIDTEATVDGRRGGLRHHRLMMNCRAYKHSTSISTTLVYW